MAALKPGTQGIGRSDTTGIWTGQGDPEVQRGARDRRSADRIDELRAALARRGSRCHFDPDAWEDFLYWLGANRKMATRITRLIGEIQRNPFAGIGQA